MVDYDLFRDLDRLGPCGTGNPEPLVAVLGLTVQRVRAANGGHTQLALRRERDVLDGIAFGREDLAGALSEGDRIDVVARLASRTFGGLETLQLEIRDVSASGAHPRAAAVLGRAAAGDAGPSVVPGLPAAAPWRYRVTRSGPDDARPGPRRGPGPGRSSILGGWPDPDRRGRVRPWACCSSRSPRSRSATARCRS